MILWLVYNKNKNWPICGGKKSIFIKLFSIFANKRKFMKMKIARWFNYSFIYFYIKIPLVIDSTWKKIIIKILNMTNLFL